MPRRGAHQQPPSAERDDVVLGKIAVRALGAARRRQHDLAAGALLQQPGAGHMVGVNMGFERRDQIEAEFAEQRRIPPHLLEHRIDQHRRTARPVAEQIGIGRGLRIEKLSKNQHHALPARASL